jgi:Xaa-Pro aminopeptidase
MSAVATPSSIPIVTPKRYEERLQRAQAALADRGAGALLVGVGTDLRWLIGYEAMPLERLTMLVVQREGRPTLIVPRLEASSAQGASGVEAGLVDLMTWTETEDPIRNVADTLQGGAADSGAELLVSDSLRAAFLLRLQAGIPTARFGLASTITSPMRQVKDAEEVELLRLAAHAADRTVKGISSGRLVGRTEGEVAREIRDRLVAEGHDEASFQIVASGPNSASPHHGAGDRVIKAGEPIVFDIGGRIGGYYSDITRTVWVTGGDDARGPDDTFRNLFAILYRAQESARAGIAPGVPCAAIDRTARDIIDAAGHGEHFFHRTGHGIGLDGHEDPYLVAGNSAPLAVGNAFSVEPGIYLEGRYGARIEDILACGPDGPDELNQLDRGLAIVSGV